LKADSSLNLQDLSQRENFSQRRSSMARVYNYFEFVSITERAPSSNFWLSSTMQQADLTAPSQDIQQFRQSIRLRTADHHLTCLATRFPGIASAIHNFVVTNPREISQRLFQCGLIFTGSV
jgi:hypothetical protein